MRSVVCLKPRSLASFSQRLLRPSRAEKPGNPHVRRNKAEVALYLAQLQVVHADDFGPVYVHYLLVEQVFADEHLVRPIWRSMYMSAGSFVEITILLKMATSSQGTM